MTTFLSVGIDVGTTSTHLTFTRLTIVNVALVNQSPLPKIENREVIFQSPIHMTPLTLDGNIDAEAVFALIRKEYERAAINRDDIKVGAAIVTGETALKRNAREVIEKLCLLSGDLVAVSAGPHLEALLSARGSGSAAASQQNGSTILNIDIGGGTMNLALHKSGALVSTHCLGIGGRCVQLKPFCDRSSRIYEISQTNAAGRSYLPYRHSVSSHELGQSAQSGESNVAAKIYALTREDLLQAADAIASDVVDFIIQGPGHTKLNQLPLSSFETDWATPDEIWLCGGVAEFMLDAKLDRFKFLDLGGLLADALLSKLNSAGLVFKIPPQPIRATVKGAGMYSMQVSGATIDFDSDHLPLRNVPLVRPFEHFSQMLNSDEVMTRIQAATNRIDPESRLPTIALELPSLESSLQYAELKEIACALALAAKNRPGLRPFVLVLREDMGMALGQLFRQSMTDLNEGREQSISFCPLIVLDGIETADGDFIDIGKPVSLDANGIARTVPVVLKTLVFGSL